MPTVQHMAGGHDRRVNHLLEVAAGHGWPVSLQEGYEHRLPEAARRLLAGQTSLAAHDMRNRPDLYFADPFVLLPLAALTGRVHRQATLTEDFLARTAAYREPNLNWPVARVPMSAITPGMTLEEAARELDFTVDELKPWWQMRRAIREATS